jgi:hypothetical protein
MRRLSSIAAFSIWATATAAAAQDAPAEEPRLSVEGRGDPDGGAVVKARVSGDAASITRLVLRCRDGERILAEAEGAPPSLSLVVDGEAATFNASCDAEAEGSPLRASRSVTVAAEPDDGGDTGWIFGVALGVTVAAAVAIVVSMLVASANSPVNVGVPTVDGW